ncbi:MAG: hypothetical protein ACTMHU_05210, partial [Cellulosimicrobium funkei]
MTADGPTDPQGPEEQAGREPGQGSDDKPFQFTDKRKVDPESGRPRPEGEAGGSAGDDAETDPLAGLDFEPSDEAGVDAAVLAAKAEAAEHLDAL